MGCWIFHLSLISFKWFRVGFLLVSTRNIDFLDSASVLVKTVDIMTNSDPKTTILQANKISVQFRESILYCPIIKSMEEVDSKPTSRITVIVRGANISILVGQLSFAILWKVNSASFNPLALIILHSPDSTELNGKRKFSKMRIFTVETPKKIFLFSFSIQKEIF